MKLMFNNRVDNWEEIEASEILIRGTKYYQFTPADGRNRVVKHDNKHIRERYIDNHDRPSCDDCGSNHNVIEVCPDVFGTSFHCNLCNVSWVQET